MCEKLQEGLNMSKQSRGDHFLKMKLVERTELSLCALCRGNKMAASIPPFHSEDGPRTGMWALFSNVMLLVSWEGWSSGRYEAGPDATKRQQSSSYKATGASPPWPLHSSCVTLGNITNLSEHQFLKLSNKDNNEHNTHFARLL